MTKFTLFASSLLIAGVVASTAPAAFAADLFDTTTQTQNVRTDDLNLGTDAGVATLNQRIRVAARAVCGEPSPPVSLADMGYHDCVAKALHDAQAKTSAIVAMARTGSFSIAAATPGR